MHSVRQNSNVVIKIGGSTLGSDDTTLEDLIVLQKEGIIPVVVHGGGKIISQWMAISGIVPEFVRGLRVTDERTLEVVVAVLGGLVNKQLVAKIGLAGGKAVGLTGIDGALFIGSILDEDLGAVGEITKVDVTPLTVILENKYIPVIAPIALADRDSMGGGYEFLNINGDTAAGALAVALGAEKLIFLTDVEGVLDSSGKVVSHLSKNEAELMISEGIIEGGMIPKLEACLYSLPYVSETWVVDGRHPNALLNALGSIGTGTRVG
jgi:acetylglutamate kinase